MKTLLLARHGTAEERRLGENDFDRTLTETGKKESAFAGKRLRRMNVVPEIIISSPAPRALETAKIISGKIKFAEEKIRTEKVLYTGNVQQVLKILQQISGTKKMVMLCGHNPLLEEIFASLCGGKVKEIHKGDIVGISFDRNDWKNIKENTGRNNFIITQTNPVGAGQNQPNMKNIKPKNKKKELQAQIADLITAFAKTKTKTSSGKIRKSVKEASKLVAKAIYKTLNSEVTAKKKTVVKKKVRIAKGKKAKPVVKKNPVKKTTSRKITSQNLGASMNNLTAKISSVESNPLRV